PCVPRSQNIREIHLANDDVPNLRTAAFRMAIEKIASAFLEMGLSRRITLTAIRSSRGWKLSA
ncbi:TPA: hypothetical protein DCE37_15980, partial [Candidatus Latescibacteria bacterium]|nr:hypothetical protein [Candidatus Latescibacterota bacterium]